MRELNQNEIMAVSGGNMSAILSYIGEAIIDADMIVNQIFNTNIVSSVGRLSDAVGLGSIHYAIDSAGYAISKTVAVLGEWLGGDASRITYHFEEEWGA